jgi:hypothetical protein
MHKKAVSALLSTIIVIGLIVTIAGIVGPWAMNFSRRQVNNTQGNVDNQISCQSTAYDFDASYGSNGVDWDFSGTSDWLRAKVLNTGSINLHSFSFQIYINGTGYKFFQAKGQDPEKVLKPGQSIILDANITEDLSGTLTEVRILNGVCKAFILTQEF